MAQRVWWSLVTLHTWGFTQVTLMLYRARLSKLCDEEPSLGSRWNPQTTITGPARVDLLCISWRENSNDCEESVSQVYHSSSRHSYTTAAVNTRILQQQSTLVYYSSSGHLYTVAAIDTRILQQQSTLVYCSSSRHSYTTAAVDTRILQHPSTLL